MGHGGGRIVKFTVNIAEPGLKVIWPVYFPGASPATSTPTLAVVLPPALIEPLPGLTLSQDAFEEADQEPAPHPLPLLMVTLWLDDSPP